MSPRRTHGVIATAIQRNSKGNYGYQTSTSSDYTCTVRTPDGREFAIGSGFTDAERAAPPPLGSWITYRYNGETATGLPRFARFLRRRPGGPPPEPSTRR